MKDNIITVLDLGMMSKQVKQQFDADINNKKTASTITKKARELVKAPTCLFPSNKNAVCGKNIR